MLMHKKFQECIKHNLCKTSLNLDEEKQAFNTLETDCTWLNGEKETPLDKQQKKLINNYFRLFKGSDLENLAEPRDSSYEGFRSF